ncbi:hypothetical protein [Winogradskyella sp.]|uniref:hypothetical protein n=1 Tax=Winogradskyella sp. TaxID=1883156 RepID=UPI0026018BEE|nr:hypothetical protein [Winogradskyella sp.]
MAKNQTSNAVQPSGKIPYNRNPVIEYINNVVIGFSRFLKSSYLSITFIAIILVLVQSLDQANTLLVDMVEKDKFSLVLCYAVISFFAAVLSHYPRYIYYSKDINDSKDAHSWYAYKLWLNYYIFTFKRIDKDYAQDYKAKFFRQVLGLVIFSIWHYYIYQAFHQKLVLIESIETSTIKYITIAIAVLPALSLIILLQQLYVYQNGMKKAKPNNMALYNSIDQKRKKFTRRGASILLVMMVVVLVAATITLIVLDFSLTGYWLLQIMTFLVSMLYVLFRVFRVYVISYNFKFYHISNSVGFLRFYLVIFLILIGHLVYSNFAVYYNLKITNAMFMLLSCFFIIYYILACSLKYYFVLDVLKDQKEYLLKIRTKKPSITPKGYLNNSMLIKKENRNNLEPLDDQKEFAERRRRISSILTILFIIICVISCRVEKHVHELEVFNTEDKLCDSINKAKNTIKMETFKTRLLKNVPENESMLFVAAHGGGLKANIWTMKVLNDIQKKSKGKFFNQTVSLSGASGGMMGLSLYSVLSGKYPNNYEAIAKEIDTVAYENFASRDVAFTFGADFVRKLAPFHFIGKYRDRSYYAMVRYQNIVESKNSRTLSTTSFNTFWKENIYKPNGYYPSLIVNTAKTSGKRGVFYSIDYRENGKIFSNSDKLSQLNEGFIAFYEAVSTTNRFPALSPAAKINGYGHYIDAGAIDNSGLLSSLDLYTYLQRDKRFKNRQKVFVEINNGKSSYIWYLLKKFSENIKSKRSKYPEHIFIEEIEQDNIVADIKTGLNLDKIPHYLADFLEGSQKKDTLKYVPVYLPFHIDIDDIEDFIGGDIECEDLEDELQLFLEIQNKKLKIDLDDNGSTWTTYEPTLARHLSKSTINYYNKVINGEIMKAQVDSVLKLLK